MNKRIINYIKIQAKGRISYSRMVQRVCYAKPRQESASGPIDFTPHDHLLDDLDSDDQKHFDKMYDFHMGHYGSFLHDLNHDEKSMLEFYRPVKFNMMNRYLGKDDPAAFRRNLSLYGSGDFHSDDDIKLMMKDLMKHEHSIKSGINIMNGIISRSPIPHDMIVYRGMRKIHPDNAPGIGKILHAPGFSSTSLNADISRNFSIHNAIMRIHVPKGTRMAPVSASQIDDRNLDRKDERFKRMENEVLLGPGHSFQVTKPIYHNPDLKLHILNVKLLPQGPPPEGSHQFP